jgi:hypothetical protein
MEKRKTAMTKDIDYEVTRRAARARFNQLRARAKELFDLMDLCEPDTMEGCFVGDMRATVEDITQQFHEFAAYHNAYRTHVKQGHSAPIRSRRRS